METQEKKVCKKCKTPVSSIVMYSAAAIVAIMAVAYLAMNIYMFNTYVAQYVAQGYKAADVRKQLMITQMLPKVFELVGLYGGMAVALVGAGIINSKVSKVAVNSDVVENCVIEENVSDSDAKEETNTVVETSEVEETKDAE